MGGARNPLPSLDALIIGGGPAGLTAAGALVRHGLNVVCIDPTLGRPSPQSAHVHHVAAETWAAMQAHLPGLDVGFKDLGSWPDRADVDRCLATSLPAGTKMKRAAFRSARHAGGRWKVSLSNGATLHTPLLIDASGRSRRSPGAIADHLDAPIPVDEGPASGSYRSCCSEANASLCTSRRSAFPSGTGDRES